MKTVYKWLISTAVVFGLSACDEVQTPDIDEMLTSDESADNAGDALQISDIKFSDDNKEMYLSARLLHDIGDYDIMDSTHVVIKPHQQIQMLPGKFGDEIQPVITKIKNPSREVLKNMDLKLLIMVDLSLPQHQVDAELHAVRDINTLLGQQGVYIAFMQGENVSETYEASDYVIDHYFVHHDPSYTYLYRSILTKLDEFMDPQTTIGNAHRKVLVVMSGGKTYENDLPVDPQHFAIQQQLTNKTTELKNKLWAYYVNFSANTQSDNDLMALTEDTDDSNIMQFFCKDLGGIYQPTFNWQEMETDMMSDFNIDPAKYEITLENPDGKIYRGTLHKLEIGLYDKKTNDLVAKGTTTFTLGTIYNPVIIHDETMIQIITGGIVLLIIVFLLAWLILQFIEPFIRYQLFKRKHVISYSGSKMSVNGLEVAESCYLCKAPFETGDEIVVKCKHTMHKACWDENEYHCPEHGRHCKEGSHYYNKHNLLDGSNPLYLMKWVLVAIISAFVAWCVFINQDYAQSMSLIQSIHSFYHELTSTTDEKGSLSFVYGSYLSDLPAFGQTVGFMITFFLSFFTVRRRKWLLRLSEMVLRAFLAGLVSCLSCLFGCMVAIILHIETYTFLIDWIPWLLLSIVIMLAVTIKTRTPIRRTFFVASCSIALLSMLMWGFIFFNNTLNYRLSLLIGFIVYAVAIAICIARETPRSERYFLHVEGAIKEMDIALYKWLRNETDRVVTIGKSVDCSIQLSWDINGKAAPVQAEIKKYKNSLRLTALEEGVIVNNKPLEPGKETWLYHGKKFTIGNTTFTYIEKDIS